MSWFVDAHVHYHPSFGWRAFLSGAFAHLDRWQHVGEVSGEVAGCLCFVDLHGEPELERLVDACRSGDAARAALLPAGCALQATSEGTAWRLERPHGSPLLLVHGRQIATREGLEVLALSCSADIPDRLSLEQTLEISLASAAVTVIPWGFGKWWLGRGRAVASAFAAQRAGRIYLGDNGNRSAVGPAPALFAAAARRAVPVLPGSDPLPFASHAGRVLGYGFRLDGDLDPRRPGASLRAALAARDHPLPVVGRRTGLPRFAFDQLRMQWLVQQRRARGTDLPVEGVR